MNEKNSGNPEISEVLNEKNAELQKEKYNEYIKNMTPKTNPFMNCIKAFVVGGAICLIGEIFNNIYIHYGFDKETAGLFGMMSLICLSIVLTGFNIYQKIGQFAGAGGIVPITGFANSVASPAIEFQAEGDVFGVGCRIFSIAGPVILYGIFCSWILGVIYWIGKMVGWF